MKIPYVAGVDVGLRGVGICMIQVDDDGNPVKILAALTHVHDSGVDADFARKSITRLRSSGMARRLRRFRRNRVKRLRDLDAFLAEINLPVVDWSDQSDQFYPWHARAALADQKIDDPKVRDELLSVALRHMARHRGWRNPYTSTASLHTPKPPSSGFRSFKKATESKLGRTLPADSTLAQIAVEAIAAGHVRLRNPVKTDDGKKKD